MKQITVMESTLQEAFAQVDALEQVNPKERHCLRLLTEEMFSMIAELLKNEKLTYQIECEDKKYVLRVSVKTRVSEEARERFLSMSSDGRNAANKGIKGMLGAVIESLLYGGDADILEMPWSYGMNPYGSDPHIWTLSEYMHTAPREKVKDDWDGLEKSIIVNFADDVEIGVRSGRLEMAVTKAFA